MGNKNIEDYLEECIAQENTRELFLAGYRILFTPPDLWLAFQEIYRRYKDVKNIQRSMEDFLMRWFENYSFHDFKGNRKLANQIFSFVKSKMKSRKLLKRLKETFINKISEEMPMSIRIEPRMHFFGYREDYFTSFKVEAFAYTLHGLSINLFKNLCFDRNCLKSEIVSTLAAFFDHIEFHVASHILWPSTSKLRAKELQFFLRSTKILYKLQNYDMLYAIYTALDFPEIKGLRRTWKKVSNKDRKFLSKLDMLFDDRDYHGNYRREVFNLSGPYVPIFFIFKKGLMSSIDENQGLNVIKIAGKFLSIISHLRRVDTQTMISKSLKEMILKPALSQDKIQELYRLREGLNPETSSESPCDSPRSINYSDVSDTELSPSPFGSPRARSSTMRLSENAVRCVSKTSSLQRTLSAKNLSKNTITRNPGIYHLRLPQEGEKLEKVPTEKWTVHLVFEWLKSLDMDQYSTLFMGNGVNGKKLLNLDREDLITLGIETGAHRKILLKEIQKLSRANS